MTLELDHWQIKFLKTELGRIRENEKELPECFRNSEVLNSIISKLKESERGENIE